MVSAVTQIRLLISLEHLDMNIKSITEQHRSCTWLNQKVRLCKPGLFSAQYFLHKCVSVTVKTVLDAAAGSLKHKKQALRCSGLHLPIMLGLRLAWAAGVDAGMWLREMRGSKGARSYARVHGGPGIWRPGAESKEGHNSLSGQVLSQL